MRAWLGVAVAAAIVVAGACSDYEGADAPSVVEDAGLDAGNTVLDAGSTTHDAGSTLHIDVSAPADLQPGQTTKVHVSVRSDLPLGAAPVKLSLATTPIDAGASPLSFAQTQIDLSPDLPETDIQLSADDSARHGFYSLAIAASATTASGELLRAQSDFTGRVVGRPAELDTGFGPSGTFSANPDSNAYAPSDLYVYPDGRFLVVGHRSSDLAFIALRFFPDGTRDPSFGGQPDTSFLGQNPKLALLADGSFAIDYRRPFADGGSESQVAVAHMTADGQVDRASILTDPVTLLQGAEGLGRILSTENGFLVLGELVTGSGTDGAVRAYLPSGEPDTSFQQSGQLLVHFADSTTVNTMTRSAAGDLVIGGEMSNGLPATNSSFITRFGHDGTTSPITTFNGSSGTSIALGVAQRGNGYASVGWVLEDQGPRIHIDAFRDATFELDGAFNGTGDQPTAFAPGVLADEILIDADLRVLVGAGLSGTTTQFQIARLGVNGQFDPTFTVADGGTGFAQPGVPGWVRRMAFTEGGRELLVVGLDGSSMRLARYWLR